MNKTAFLRNLQYHNVYDGSIDEIKSYFSNESKFRQPFMKLKLEECSKRALTSADALLIVYVLWGILMICIIQAILDYHGYLNCFYPEIYPDIETIHNVKIEDETAIEMIQVKTEDTSGIDQTGKDQLTSSPNLPYF